MTTRTAPAPAPETNAPEVPEATDAALAANQAMLAGTLASELGFAPIAKPAPAPAPKPMTARDFVKVVDLAVLIAAGEAVNEIVPEELREQVAQLVANQLHHLSTPKVGWPSTVLPTPDRSEWR